MPLTDIAVRQARPKDKIYTLTDGRGLGLCVKPGGGKSWHFRYYWSGKQKRIALGKYPEISLKEARGRCEAARALVAQGINPLKRRQQEVLVKRLAADRLFQSVFDQWLAHRSLVLQPGRQSTLEQIQRIFRKVLRPGSEDVLAYGRAIRAKPDIDSVLLPIGTGIEVSRYMPAGQ